MVDNRRSAALLGVLCLLPCTAPEGAAHAASSTIGRTWPITEPDALAEIEAKAATLPSMASRFAPSPQWAAMRSAHLAQTQRDMVRTIVPFYTLDADIRLPDGRLLYPKGFTLNPLLYVRLTQRLVIVHASELGWAISQAHPSDWIIVTGGPQGTSDPIALSRKVGRPIFILEDAVKQRLGLTVAPVIVSQSGSRLLLDERVAHQTGKAAS